MHKKAASGGRACRVTDAECRSVKKNNNNQQPPNAELHLPLFKGSWNWRLEGIPASVIIKH